MAVRMRPMSFSAAFITESPSHLSRVSLISSNPPVTATAELSAPTQVQISPGWREASSKTVARADGPASSGTARGKIKGSRPPSPPKISDVVEKIILIATSSKMTPPATSMEGWLRFISFRKPWPPNMKVSSTA